MCQTVSCVCSSCRGRQRRGADAEIYTMSRFIEIVESIENNGLLTSSERVADYLRKLAYDSWYWALACGISTTGTVWSTGLNDADIAFLKKMIGHGYDVSTGVEKGVVLTSHGTLALGHVITGISCGGFNRDTRMIIPEIYGSTSSHLDNLLFTTIAGDLGQTALQYYSDPQTYSLFGPTGHWNSETDPRVYTISSKDTEMTEAEILGDMDGVILGTIIPMVRQWKLSRVFREYYQEGGIKVGGRVYSATNRGEMFGELLSEVELDAQSLAFAEVYYKTNSHRYGDTSRAALLKHIPSVVHTFYKTYVPCTDTLKTKYTMEYFVGLVEELESETGLGVVDMTKAIVGVSEYFKTSYFSTMLNVDNVGRRYTDNFAWFVLREMVTHGLAPSDKRREIGVIEASGDVLAIGHVLAGIHAWTDTGGRPYGATVSGSLAQVAANRNAANSKTADIMGATGTWDHSSCPPKYRLNKTIKTRLHTTRAELLGDIDGFVLGKTLRDWLKTNPRLTLSKALKRYYFVDNQPISSKTRLTNFKKFSIDKSNVIKQTELACRDIQRAATAIYQMTDDTFCNAAAKRSVDTFFETILLSSGTYCFVFLVALLSYFICS